MRPRSPSYIFRLVVQSEDETREEDAEIDPFEDGDEYGAGSKVYFRLTGTSRQNSKTRGKFPCA